RPQARHAQSGNVGGRNSTRARRRLAGTKADWGSARAARLIKEHFVKQKALLVLAIGLLLGADGKEDAKNDQGKPQGKWKLTSAVIDGTALPKNQVKGELVFDKDKYSYKTGDGEKGSGKFKLDVSKKPRHLDSVPDDGPVQGQTVEQIYEIDGD